MINILNDIAYINDLQDIREVKYIEHIVKAILKNNVTSKAYFKALARAINSIQWVLLTDNINVLKLINIIRRDIKSYA